MPDPHRRRIIRIEDICCQHERKRSSKELAPCHENPSRTTGAEPRTEHHYLRIRRRIQWSFCGLDSTGSPTREQYSGLDRILLCSVTLRSIDPLGIATRRPKASACRRHHIRQMGNTSASQEYQSRNHQDRRILRPRRPRRIDQVHLQRRSYLLEISAKNIPSTRRQPKQKISCSRNQRIDIRSTQPAGNLSSTENSRFAMVST